MITFETKSGLKIRVGGKMLKESHTRLIKFFKELKKIQNSKYDHYAYMQADIDRALEKYEIDLEAI